MDLVLGLSMTASSIRWVLVDGAAGEDSVTVDRGSVPADSAFPADSLLDRLLDRPVHAIGLNWTTEAEGAASAVWQGLTDRGVENVIAVSDVEAAEALACGIADLSGCERVVVGVAEPGTSVLAAVTPDGVTADRVDPAALTDVDGFDPDAIFVLGSGDVAGVVSALEQRNAVPVVSADEADLALARGAALASASAVSILDAQAAPGRRTLSPTATLVSVLAAAVVTFVVSLSAALGMTLTPDSPAPQMARSVTEPAPEPVEKPAPVKAAPPEPEAAPPPPVAPPVAEPVAVEIPAPAAPVLPEAPLPEAPPPVYDEPVAPAPVLPPAPAYVPPPPPANYLPPAPAAPAYVPPAAPVPAMVPQVPAAPQQPRLRDRIIERIPIINRFHEPEY